MMSNSSHYYGMPNGFPHASNGPQAQPQQQLYQQQQPQSVVQPPQTAPINPAKGMMMTNGPPSATVAPTGNGRPWQEAVAPFPAVQTNGPPSSQPRLGPPKPSYGAPSMGQPHVQQPPPTTVNNQRVASLAAATNGNSASSSRTSSPALVGSNGGLPSSGPQQFPSSGGLNNNQGPPPSSQQQPPQMARPGAATGGGGQYNLSPNNNNYANNGGVSGNHVNTPPRSSSGMSTPVNSSTPNLNGAATVPGAPNAISKLTASVQDLSLNRPPTTAGATTGGVLFPPVPASQQQPLTNGLTNTPQSKPMVVNGPATQGPMAVNPSLQQQPAGPLPPSYGHLPPPLNQQSQQPPPNQAQRPPLTQQQPPAFGGIPNGPSNPPPAMGASQYALAGSANTGAPPATLNKRPMYPAAAKSMTGGFPQQPQQMVPQPQPGGNYGQQQQQQQPQQHAGMPPMPQQQNYAQPPTQQQYQHQQQFQHQQPPQQQPAPQQLHHQPGFGAAASAAYPGDASGNVVRGGFNRLWGNNTVDLLQNRHILPTDRVRPPTIHLVNPFQESINCNPDIFRCTLTKIPETSALLQKSRLPLGVLIHPFRDLNNLPVISCNTIVRCRSCRTYINPFVFFVDSKKWKCNLCYRVNELPEEFQYDPVTKTYGDPTRRPEIKSSTIEFIAPSEYMLRPPQPAIYLFLLDVSSLAQQSGYLHTVCNTLTEHLENLPGDARTQVGFIAYNSAIHFYNIAEGFNQPHEVTVLDVEDVFLPYPDNLLVNLKECKELIKDLLKQLPKRFEHTHDTHSALGAALQVAFKMMSASGGRVTVFQTCLPNHGPGALQSREDPNNRSSKDVAHLGPATDFYKRLALECSGQQIAVDLFLLNSQYCDLATISGISKFSGGCLHHIPLYSESKPQLVKTLRKCFERYLTRKVGFEAVMRVRCTRGLAIHTFHGNFFVRSTDLLSLPNVNPDAGFGMQITYEESLAECKSVCFQAALLYTSSKAERRIRVHTLCIPVTASLTEVMYSADAQCIVGLLSKMAVDRSLSSSLSDARDAFINATVDIFSAFKIAQNLPQNSSTIVAPENLSLLPLYILALLKHPAFRTGTSTRLDDRVFAMCEMKSLPLDQLIRYIYPEFYVLDCLFVTHSAGGYVDDGHKLEPPRLQLSAEKLDSRSMFLLDCGSYMFIYIGSNVASSIVQDILGYNSVSEIPDFCIDLPSRETAASEALLTFLDSINEEKPYTSYVQVIRDTSQFRSMLVEKFVDDRNPNSLAYYEFLQHLRTQIK
uniref:Putative vesicle coat complex copii subunit sfb3 n=2 Tax=Anopheles triannulatus TaxID=58253 RepID=A0A2M4A281_9DIPT